MSDAAIPFRSIADIGVRYRDGSLSPVDVTRTCLTRIEAYDRELNSFLCILDNAALDQAATAEKELRSGHDRGALHGIPVAVKDLVAVAGVPTSFGSDPVFREVPDGDAALVRRLRDAGAVLVGKTSGVRLRRSAPRGRANQQPLESWPKLWRLERRFRRCRGVGLCYAAVGTDTGGSIRIPAAHCGIVGLKPTFGLVELAGVSLLSWSLDHAGPLARSCADAAALSTGLVGRPFAADPVDPSRLRLGVIGSHRDAAIVTPRVRAAFDTACEALGAAGAVLEDVMLDGLEESAHALLFVLLPEASVIHRDRLLRHADAFAEQTRSQLELGFLLPATAHVRAQQFRRYLGAELQRLLVRFDALLSPAVPWEAPAEDPAVDGESGCGEMLCAAPTNLCGLPSLTVPCGFGDCGLPVGLQITGRPHADEFVLRIGAASEIFRTPQVPPRYLGS